MSHKNYLHIFNDQFIENFDFEHVPVKEYWKIGNICLVLLYTRQWQQGQFIHSFILFESGSMAHKTQQHTHTHTHTHTHKHTPKRDYR